MQFSDFSRKLKGVIGGKSSAATFTKTLFETILVEDETFAEDESILSEYSKDSHRYIPWGSPRRPHDWPRAERCAEQ